MAAETSAAALPASVGVPKPTSCWPMWASAMWPTNPPTCSPPASPVSSSWPAPWPRAPRCSSSTSPARGSTRRRLELGRVLMDLATRGMAVLFVEHDMSLVMKICDHVSVLDYGEWIATRRSRHGAGRPAVQAAYWARPMTPGERRQLAGALVTIVTPSPAPAPPHPSGRVRHRAGRLHASSSPATVLRSRRPARARRRPRPAAMLIDLQRPRRLRPHRGGPRRIARGPRGHGLRPARSQRCGQVDTAQGGERPAAGHGGPRLFDGEEIAPFHPRPPGPPGGHVRGPRGPRRLPQPDGGREPAHVQLPPREPARWPTSKSRATPGSPSSETRRAAGRPVVGGRAADVGPGPGAVHQAPACCSSTRSRWAWPRSVVAELYDLVAQAGGRGGHHHLPRRAVRPDGPGHRRSGRPSWSTADNVRSGPPDEVADHLLRPTWARRGDPAAPFRRAGRMLEIAHALSATNSSLRFHSRWAASSFGPPGGGLSSLELHEVLARIPATSGDDAR